MTTPFLSLQHFSVKFNLRSGSISRRASFYAIRDLFVNIHKKETFCLIGESGSGKTTLIWAMLGLLPFHEGEIIFKGRPIKKRNDPAHQSFKAGAQMVFQDPAASLSPFLTLGQSIEEPLRARRIEKKERSEIAKNLALETGLSLKLLERRPANVSGGQNQRACIARALSTEPEILFLDEPLTALDAVIQKKIAKLLCRIKKEYPFTSFLVTHDLSLVKSIGDRVAVIYLGIIVETAPVKIFFSNPCHPYSKALLSSVLKPGIRRGKPIILQGEIPSLQHPPAGCPFYTRCPSRLLVCKNNMPDRKILAKGHEVLCHLF
jgi:peptide/nickel transport system ATP-binding protein